MKTKNQQVWFAVVLVGVLCLLLYPKIYFSIRYKYSEDYSFESYVSNHTIKVYYDSWYNGFALGGGSDAPCIVKLIDNKTGKCLYVTKLNMIQHVNSRIISRNSILWIGYGVEWKF